MCDVPSLPLPRQLPILARPTWPLSLPASVGTSSQPDGFCRALKSEWGDLERGWRQGLVVMVFPPRSG